MWKIVYGGGHLSSLPKFTRVYTGETTSEGVYNLSSGKSFENAKLIIFNLRCMRYDGGNNYTQFVCTKDYWVEKGRAYTELSAYGENNFISLDWVSNTKFKIYGASYMRLQSIDILEWS